MRAAIDLPQAGQGEFECKSFWFFFSKKNRYLFTVADRDRTALNRT
jgi:hypothetical protein